MQETLCSCFTGNGIFFRIAFMFILTGIVLAGVAVVLGAFGAHALKERLSLEMLQIFEVGVRYQMYHSLALILLSMYRGNSDWLLWSGWSFLGGIVLFSGSLYILSLSGVRAWGAVTPIGGVLLILGWLFFALGVKKI